MTLAEHIVQYFKRHSISCSVRDDIEWTLKRWVELNSLTERHINHETIKIIHSKIKVVPTGKQRRYRQAVEDICLYLRDVCQWTVYEPLSEKLIDHDLIWADKLSQHAHSANVLFQCYQKQKSIFLKLSQPPSIEFLTVTLAICLAPFSFEYIADLLNHPERIECSNNQLSVKIYHRVSKSNTSQHPPFTRYKLDLFSYKLLSTYFAIQKNQQNETENSLNKKIINWLNQQHFELSTICTRDLPFLFQSIWLYQYQVPHTLLKDIATPERHVDFDIKRREITNVHKLKPGTVDALFKISLDFSWAKGGTNSSKPKQQDWSHQTLIKQLLKTSRAELIRQLQEQAEPEWQTNNVLPKLFYQYTSELIEFGGITKPRLAQSTIKKYTSISRLLEQSPLGYSDAIHESKLQAWADHNYLKLDDEHKLLMHFFLRFISQQSLTDHLQLDHLQAPTQPMTVDAYRMAPESINNIIQILLNSKSGSHVQRLFSAVAVIISYFGMLRRGEILRLRVRDIVALQLDQCRLFQLEITKTPEGQPKSSRSRTVYIALPENYAKLIRLVLHFKHGSCQERPLLGFDNEKLSVRNIYYLLPVTRAIKLICGSDARFHHLRHAGAHLMMLQMMTMCYSGSKPIRYFSDYFELLEPELVELRFQFWLENRDFSELNEGIVFDVLVDQIGHKHYATLRWSYLHGVDWLTHFIKPETEYYSHAELRFLLGLSPTSNDLIRLLSKLTVTKSQSGKQQTIYTQDSTTSRQIKLNHIDNAKLTQMAIQRTNIQQNNNDDLGSPTKWTALNFYQSMIEQLKQNKSCIFDHVTALYLKRIKKKTEVEWQDFVTVWRCCNQHETAAWKKAQVSALRDLWQQCRIIDVNSENNSVDVQKSYCFSKKINCNVKNAKHFQLAIAQSELANLSVEFVLNVNRKTKAYRQVEILKSKFGATDKNITLKRQSKKTTFLDIQMKPKETISKNAMALFYDAINEFLQVRSK